jgi:hypothetical protein
LTEASKRNEFLEQLPGGLKEVVRRRADIEIDPLNDGTLNFSHPARERLSGLEQPVDDAPQGLARNIVAGTRATPGDAGASQCRT